MVASFLLVSCKEKTSETSADDATVNQVSKVANNNEPIKEIDKANLQTASFTIKGMTCAIGCAKTIEEELNGLEGVQKATVDFDKELATVSYDKRLLNTEKLIKVVEATADGKTYKVSNLK